MQLGLSPDGGASWRRVLERMTILARRIFYRGSRLARPPVRKEKRPASFVPRAYYQSQIGEGLQLELPLFSDLIGNEVEFVYQASDEDGAEPVRGSGLLLGTSSRYVTLGCGEMVLHLDHSRLIRLSDSAA